MRNLIIEPPLEFPRFTAMPFSKCFVVCSRGGVGDACMGFCVPSPANKAISVAMQLSANYGRGTSFLPLEVGSVPCHTLELLC